MSACRQSCRQWHRLHVAEAHAVVQATAGCCAWYEQQNQLCPHQKAYQGSTTDRGFAAAVPTLTFQDGCLQLLTVSPNQTRGSCSHGPTFRLPGGPLQLRGRRCSHPNCSHSVVPTAGLPGGLLQLQRCARPSCSHCVVPTAGLLGGHHWLRMSTSLHPILLRPV